MSVLVFSALLFATSVAAGFLGALTGLGGGVVIVPVLTLLFKVDIRYLANEFRNLDLVHSFRSFRMGAQ